MKRTLKSLAPIVLVGAALSFLTACGGEKTDPHDAPRAPKAYESVDVATLDTERLLAHLNSLSAAANAAVQAGETLEFHHLEEAITPTLVALEARAAGNPEAIATIGTLKELAIRFHEAGHDNNAVIGSKIAAKIAELEKKLAEQLK